MSKIELIKRCFSLLLFLAAIMLPASVTTAETGTTDNSQTTLDKTAQIAVILPLGGPFAEYGKALKKGYELGFSEARAANYGVKYLDSEGDPEIARTLINLVASEGDVVIASGTPKNATAWTASRACEENGLPYLIVGADQDNLINSESFFSFRLSQKHSALEQLLAAFIAVRKPEIKTMGIIYGNSPCAVKRARQLQKLCLAKGIDLALWEEWKEFSRNRDNFYDLLNKIKERQPQMLLLATNQNITNRLWQQGRQLEIMPAATIAIPVNCITTLSQPDRDPKPADQLLYATPWATPWHSFADDENESPRLNCLIAQGTAAATVIVNCLKKSPNFSAGEIIKSLESTQIDTVYGQVKFTQNPAGHQNQLPWYISSNDVENGDRIIFPAGQ